MKNKTSHTIIEQFEKAFLSIKQFLSNFSPAVIIFKLELKILENRLNSIDNIKIELEKMLSDFQNRHSRELGEILLEILRLRMLLFQSDNTKYDEAEKDEKQYREQVIADKKQKKLHLSDDEKKELKKKFRIASFLCHPDKVNESMKESAQETFIQLKEAYDSNDLKKVSEILSNLERGNYFKSKSETISKKELLKSEIEKLLKRIKSLKDEISMIKDSYSYRAVIVIDDWDSYFRKRKETLEMELEDMKNQLNNIHKLRHSV